MRISATAMLWLSLIMTASLFAGPVTAKTDTPTEATPATQVEKKPTVQVETKPANELATPTTPKIPQAVTDALNRIIKKEAGKFSVTPGPIDGLYETIIGSEIIYVTSNGHHIIVGDIRETSTGKNLTDLRRGELRMNVLNQTNESEMIVFAPEKGVKYTVSVFTDVDCPYCSKFHNEVSKLNAAGVKVRYLAFPRAGAGSKTYYKMVSVWCSDDPKKAITDAKAGRDIPEKKCNHPIDKQYALSQKLGITGTPALVLSDGELLPGYVPAEQLVTYLQQKFSPFTGDSRSSGNSK